VNWSLQHYDPFLSSPNSSLIEGFGSGDDCLLGSGKMCRRITTRKPIKQTAIENWKNGAWGAFCVELFGIELVGDRVEG
jgi:hypothetical protein